MGRAVMSSSMLVRLRGTGGRFSFSVAGARVGCFSSSSGGLPSCEAGRLRCPPRLLAFLGMSGAFSLNGCASASFAALRRRFLNGQKAILRGPAPQGRGRIPAKTTRGLPGTAETHALEGTNERKGEGSPKRLAGGAREGKAFSCWRSCADGRVDGCGLRRG